MTVSDLTQNMGAAALPWGLIGLEQWQLDFANPALQTYLRQQLMPHKLTLPLHEPLMQAAEQCLKSHQEVTASLPGSGDVWHFSPVLSHGTTTALQCYVLRGNPPAPSTAAVSHTDRFEVFLDHLPYHVWIATPHGELTWLNRALTQYAYNHAQHLDLSEGVWIDLIHPDDMGTLNASLTKALITEQPTGYRLRIKQHQGQYHWFFATMAPVKSAQGQTLYWVGSNTNIDTVKQSEDRLREEMSQLQQELQRSHNQLEQAQSHLAQLQKLDIVTQLSAGVAHDMNNLLFITGLHAGLLEKKLVEPAHREHLEVIHDTIRKAGKLASQLTGFSSRKPMAPSTIDPGRLIGEMELLLNKAVGKEVDLQIQLAADLWPIHVDRMYFENSLLNLCINARDATNGQGLIVLRAENVVLQRGDHVLISVTDDGCGMDDSTLARIFEMFFTTKAPGKGAGLGLPMVKNFLNHAGGLLEVSSTPGEGSCFRLYFPRSGASAESEPVEQELATGAADETILLIEHDLEVRNAMAQVLYELGYQVTTAYRPEVALRYLSSGLKADLIISTARMPGALSVQEMDLRLQAEGRHIPILLTSSQSSDPQSDLAQSPYPLLFKPVSMPDLAQAVRRVLDAVTH